CDHINPVAGAEVAGLFPLVSREPDLAAARPRLDLDVANSFEHARGIETDGAQIEATMLFSANILDVPALGFLIFAGDLHTDLLDFLIAMQEVFFPIQLF